MRRVVLVTGLQAAGKTTVGRLLARRLGPPAAHFDGDVLLQMVVAGGQQVTPALAPEAMRQLELRYRAAALLAQHYADHGFDFVYSDVVLGPYVAGWLDSIRQAERHLVVLAPSVASIAARERERGYDSYRGWRQPGESLEAAITALGAGLAELSRLGLWIDSSGQTAEQTVTQILADGLRASCYHPPRSGPVDAIPDD